MRAPGNFASKILSFSKDFVGGSFHFSCFISVVCCMLTRLSIKLSTFLRAMSEPSEFVYASLPAPDLEVSKAFYSKVFGWKIGGGSQGGNIDSSSTPFGLGGDTPQVYFTPPQSLALLKDKGGRVTGEQEFDGVGHANFCQDDQGADLFFLETLPELGTGSPHPPMKHGDILRCCLPVEKEAEARLFYQAVLGWELDEETGCTTNLEGPVVCLQSVQNNTKTPQMESGPYFWFRVDDLEESLRRIREAGGSTETVRRRECACVDNQGVSFGVVEKKNDFQ